MIIVVDTREQRPWTFESLNVDTTRAKLDTGDYSVMGLEKRVCIERKSLDDWIGTVMRSRARFYQELDRMRSYDFRCVIIESSVREIMTGGYRSRTAPASVMGFINEITVAQSVPVLLGGTRAESQIRACGIMRAAAKYMLKGDSKSTDTSRDFGVA